MYLSVRYPTPPPPPFRMCAKLTNKRINYATTRWQRTLTQGMSFGQDQGNMRTNCGRATSAAFLPFGVIVIDVAAPLDKSGRRGRTGAETPQPVAHLPFGRRPHSSQLRITLALKRNASACVCMLLLLLVKHDTWQDPEAQRTGNSDSVITISVS